jgi:hypothetical protein
MCNLYAIGKLQSAIRPWFCVAYLASGSLPINRRDHERMAGVAIDTLRTGHPGLVKIP